MRSVQYVRLSPEQVAEAREIAVARHEYDVSRPEIRNLRQSSENDVEIHARGIRAEFAFGIFAGLEPDRRTDAWNDWDFLIGTTRVDVKGPAYSTQALYVEIGKRAKKIDAFAVVREITPSQYAVLGYQYADLVMDPKRITLNERTGRERYEYPFHELESVNLLALLCYREGLRSEIITRIMTNTIEEVR